jgi:hypothetical protein
MLSSRNNGGLGLLQSVVFALAALSASLFSPPLALLVAWAGVLLSAREAPEHVSWPLVAFAHAGALIFASRTFEDASSDFVSYHAVYEATCQAKSGLEDTLLAFGPEIGLPAFYKLLSTLGLCGLSINGLAWLQGFITATALLLVISRWARQVTPADELPMALGGLCLMFSFFYVTQLSRQACSSIFVLAALWLARSRRGVLILLMFGALFHVTAPLIWALFVLLRGPMRRALPVLILLAAVPLLAFDQIVAFAIAHSDAFEPLAKFAIYAAPADDGGGPSSDLQGVVLLGLAGALFAWRARREPTLAADSRMLLGLAVLALAMLPVPFASTRTALPIAWFAIGAFLLRGLAGTVRPLAWLALGALLALRIVANSMPSDGAHALWFAYAPAGWIPGYWLPGLLK